jgi:RNA polymerase sigma-70 factor (ECF subfamily)
MTPADASPRAGGEEQRGFFPATHWTEIATLQDSASPGAREALENLCRIYLPAIEKHLRCFRNLPGDPHELANEFLGQFIHQDSLKRVDRNRGKFRSYVAGAIRHFLLGKWRSQARAPQIVELDEHLADQIGAPPDDTNFDCGFAEILVGNAVRGLRERFAGSRLEGHIPVLLPYLSSDPPEETLRQLAARLGVSDDLIYQNFKRIRDELYRQLRTETRRHLGPEDSVEDEIQALLRAFARSRG